MHGIAALTSTSGWLRLVTLCLFILTLQGCAAMKSSWLYPGQSDKNLARNEFPVVQGEDVIGRLAVVRLEKGDTLPDIARHFTVGVSALSDANPGVDVWVPEGGERVVLPLSFILPDAPRVGIVVNLATMRLFHFKGNGRTQKVATYPVGIGVEDRPTPMGPSRIVRKAVKPTWHVPASIAADHRKKGDILPEKVLPGPDNPLGDYALYLSRAGYLIHGTNKPASVGLKATNGCLRLYPENIEKLFRETPVATPVRIINQPYLVGQRDGVLYMEAHTPREDSGVAELQRIYAKLKVIEKKAAQPLDWQQVKKIQAEARGVPVPLMALRPGTDQAIAPPVRIQHPGALNGKPELPELDLESWYILAAHVSDEIQARRLAAMINHQGPPIPARVLAKSGSFRVIAGPFASAGDAIKAAKRLKYDLDIDGIVLDPARKG